MTAQETLITNPSISSIVGALAQEAVVPIDWRTVRLGEVFKFTSKPRGLKYSDFEYIPFIPMELIPVGHLFSSAHSLRSVADISSGTYFESGDVLVAKITPSFENGKQGIIEGLPSPFGIATTEVIAINEVPGVSDKQFLFYYLLHPGVRSAMAAKMKGTTGRQRLSTTTLANWTMLLPPLPQQRAIARVLRAVQTAIHARRSELELERERKAALMQHLLTKGTRGDPTKLTDIGEIPESWQLVRLGTEAEVITKGSSPNWQGFEYQEAGVTFVRSQNIGWGRLELDDVAYLPEAFNQKERKSIIQARDLLLNIVGASIGRAAVADESIAGGNLNQAVALVRLRKRLMPEFTMYFLLTREGQAQQHRLEKDIARANLSLADIGNLITPLPSLDEQQTIAHGLQACEAVIEAIEREVGLHVELFRTLLEELMTGHLSALPLVTAATSGPYDPPTEVEV